MTTVNRKNLVKELKSVMPGVSTSGSTAQSHCFVFKDGKVQTFNDEIACIHKTSLKIEGAIPADKFLSYLNKLSEDEIDISIQDEGSVVVKEIGTTRKSGFIIDKEITLPIDTIGSPGKWVELDPDFTEALSMVAECAGDDEDEFILTCINITPHGIEGADNHQAGYFKMDIGIEEPFCIRKTAARHIVDQDITHISDGGGDWIHFKAQDGLRISCRLSRSEKYPSHILHPLLKIKGVETRLPDGLAESSDIANIFLDERERNVSVSLKKGKMRIKGVGTIGWYSESKSIEYSGPPIKFIMNTKLLGDIGQKHKTCRIAPHRLKVKVGRFQYITALEKEGENSNDKED